MQLKMWCIEICTTMWRSVRKMGQFAKRDTFEKDGLRVTMTKITQFFSCNLLEEISRGYMIIWKDFTNMLTVFEKLQFIFRKDVYFDFLAYYEILTPLKLRALWTVFKVYNFFEPHKVCRYTYTEGLSTLYMSF